MKLSKNEIQNLLWIALGCLIMVIGVNLFLIPMDLYSTGLMGFSQEIATVLTRLTGITDQTGAIYFVLNIPIIILGWLKVGKKFTLRTFWAVILISLFQMFIPTDIMLVDDQLLAVITSGLFIGAGIGITLKRGASTGGTDIIVLYVSLVKEKSFGIYNLIFNLIVILGAILVTSDIQIAILMLILLYTVGIVIDKIHNSHEKLTLFIMTYEPDAVTESLLSGTARGVTVLDSRGGMTKANNNTLITTISKGQLYCCLSDIKSADEKAFINILPVENVVGFFPNNYKDIL